MRFWTPALLTRMSIGPTVSSIRATAAAIAAESVTSNAAACTVPPVSSASASRARRHGVRVAAVEHHRRARCREPARQRAADPAAGPGDQRDPPGDVEESMHGAMLSPPAVTPPSHGMRPVAPDEREGFSCSHVGSR